MDLLHYCEGGSMIPVDLSANCEGWIYDPNGSGIQISGSVFGIHGHVWRIHTTRQNSRMTVLFERAFPHPAVPAYLRHCWLACPLTAARYVWYAGPRPDSAECPVPVHCPLHCPRSPPPPPDDLQTCNADRQTHELSRGVFSGSGARWFGSAAQERQL